MYTKIFSNPIKKPKVYTTTTLFQDDICLLYPRIKSMNMYNLYYLTGAKNQLKK